MLAHDRLQSREATTSFHFSVPKSFRAIWEILETATSSRAESELRIAAFAQVFDLNR